MDIKEVTAEQIEQIVATRLNGSNGVTTGDLLESLMEARAPATAALFSIAAALAESDEHMLYGIFAIGIFVGTMLAENERLAETEAIAS